MELYSDMVFAGRYRLSRQLGQGGFSQVWLARDTRTRGLEVVLKVYAPGTGLDEDGVELFSEEFSLLFNIRHHNLIKPMHYDVSERMPYLVLPYCEHGSTEKMIGRMTETEAWRFLHDVSSGLAHLHGQEPPIIHQDIKPANILVDSSGAFLITDFGISTKARSTLRKSVVRESVSSGSGTMAYMGPERASRENAPVMASDVWALGVTAYELLTGDLPFGEMGGIFQKSGAEVPEVRGEWSHELKRVVELCLEKEPWDRPNAAQIYQWTEQHAAGRPLDFPRTQQKQQKKQKPSKSGRTLSDASGKPRRKSNGVRTAVISFALLLVLVPTAIIGFKKSGQASGQHHAKVDGLIYDGDSFRKSDSLRLAMECYDEAITMIEEHGLSRSKYQSVYDNRARLSNDIDTKFNGCVNMAEMWVNADPEEAIICYDNALSLKEDTDVREKRDRLMKKLGLHD